MKKKLIVIALCFASMLNLIACGGKAGSDNASASPSQSEPSQTAEASQESSSAIGVDKNLLTVDVTLPAMFWEDEDLSTFDTDSYAKENGFNSAKVNDDGSVTINMSKARHTELMASFTDSINESYSDMIGSEDYPYIKDIKHTNNFGKIDIYVDKAGYDADWLSSAFLPLGVYFSAAYYQALAGDGAKCQINIIDSSTNDTIGSVIYPDALEDSTSNSAAPSRVMEESGTLDDSYIEINDAFLAKDYDGNTAIVVNYAWTNKSSETKNAWSSVIGNAFQDGIQIDRASFTYDNPFYDSSLEDKQVRPGTTIDVQIAFTLSNETSDVEVEFSSWSWDSNDTVIKTFDPTILDRK